MSLGICDRRLPDWLPGIYLTSLMFEQAKSVSIKLRRRLNHDSRVAFEFAGQAGCGIRGGLACLLRARQMLGPLPGCPVRPWSACAIRVGSIFPPPVKSDPGADHVRAAAGVHRGWSWRGDLQLTYMIPIALGTEFALDSAR